MRMIVKTGMIIITAVGGEVDNTSAIGIIIRCAVQVIVEVNWIKGHADYDKDRYNDYSNFCFVYLCKEILLNILPCQYFLFHIPTAFLFKLYHSERAESN